MRAMRHHPTLGPQPFTVSGDMSFIVKSFSMKDGMSRNEFEDALTGDQIRVFVHTDKTCLVTSWECTCEAGQEPQYTVVATPVRMHTPVQKTKTDPWVQVGATAVDGTFAELAEAFNVPASGVGASIHGLIEGERVVQVRGMNLRPCEWVPVRDGVGMVLCDVVRRQSDLDAEIRELARQNEQDELEDYLAHPRSTCPECGPHGNAGRVLLLESWVDCTTCRPQIHPGDVDGEGIPVLAAMLRHDPVLVNITYNDDSIRTGMQMVDKAMSGFVVPSAEEYNRYIVERLQVPFIVKPNGDVEGTF